MLQNNVLKAMWLASAILLPACKPTVSQVQSVDNFVADSTLVRNVCAGVKGGKTLFKGTQKVVLETITAVPYSVQEDFFNDFGGTLQLVKNPKETCFKEYTVAERAQLPDVLSCWKRNPVRIIISDKDADIRQELVRSFGQVHSEVLINRAPNGATLTIDGNAIVDPVGIKTEIALALLEDVAHSKIYKLSQFAQRLPSDVLDARLTEAERRTKFAVVALETRREFVNLALAEAFDSWFCVKETRQKFAKEFPNSCQVFAPYAKSLDPATDSADICEVDRAASTATKIRGSSAYCDFHCRYGTTLSAMRKKGIDVGRQADTSYAKSALAAAQPQAGLSLGLFGGMGRFFNRIFGGAAYRPNSGGTPYAGTGAGNGFSGNTGNVGNVVNRGGNNGGGFPTPGSLPSQNPYPTPGTYPTPTPSFTGGGPGVNGNAGGYAGGGGAGGAGGDIDQQLLVATNAERQSNAQLTLNSKLTAGCAQHAQWMASTGKLTHDKNGYQYTGETQVAENIAMGTTSVAETMKMWNESPGHRANIVNTTYTTFGAALSGTYWCQQFGF